MIFPSVICNKKFSEKWDDFRNSIDNFGCVLQDDISVTSIKYLNTLTKKIKNIVTPAQAVSFVINNALGKKISKILFALNLLYVY